MRVSTEEDDPGYDAWNSNRARWRHAAIYLDGVESKGILTFDTDEGLIKRTLRNEEGNIYCLPKTDIIATETVRGVVTLKEPST